MDQDRIWTLLALKLTGEATPQELQELDSLLQQFPGASHSAELFDKLFSPEQTPPGKEAEDAYSRHLQRMKTMQDELSAFGEVKQQEAVVPTHEKPPRRSFYNNGLLLNQLRIAGRMLLRNKVYSFINITGLALGMVSAIIILLWIVHTFSVDDFHTNRDRIYKVYNRVTTPDDVEVSPQTPAILTPTLQAGFPQIEQTARANWVGAFVFTVGANHFETSGLLIDPGFLKIFDIPLISGDPDRVLSGPHSLVLSEQMARKLFGSTDVVGKLVKVDSNAVFTVTAVARAMPRNSNLRFDYLAPWSYMKEVGWHNDAWDANAVSTFVLLRPGVEEDEANALIRNVTREHSSLSNIELFLHPMKKWNLYSNFKHGVAVGGDITYVRLFGAIAAFILLIACINYMNLSTARSIRRAREVGIRKVIGAGRSSLVRQFLGESVLVALLAGILALAVLNPGLRWFEEVSGLPMDIPLDKPLFWLSFAGFILFTGLLAGSYPAFYLSAFRPITVLKSGFRILNTVFSPRKVLVVFQFTFAISLIIATMVIYRQIQHALNRKTGYAMEDLAYVFIKGDIPRNYTVIRQALLNSGAVTSVTRTSSPITDVWSNDNEYKWKGKAGNYKPLFNELAAGDDFVKTVGLKLLQGRDFDLVRYPSDSSAMLLNASAAKAMGVENPVGMTVESRRGTWKVIGVVNDFVSGQPYMPVRPMLIMGPKFGLGTMHFRLSSNAPAAENLKTVEAIFRRYNPGHEFLYWFADKAYTEKFSSEKSMGQLSTAFAGLTIFISCLGLFALATYMAENRIKEIGVRKVLGASASAIAALLSKDFLKLVLIAFMLASPIAWWAMSNWLQNYPYRITINWWIFALTGFIAIGIAVFTVSFQSIKAALSNPAKSLRSE